MPHPSSYTTHSGGYHTRTSSAAGLPYSQKSSGTQPTKKHNGYYYEVNGVDLSKMVFDSTSSSKTHLIYTDSNGKKLEVFLASDGTPKGIQYEGVNVSSKSWYKADATHNGTPFNKSTKGKKGTHKKKGSDCCCKKKVLKRRPKCHTQHTLPGGCYPGANNNIGQLSSILDRIGQVLQSLGNCHPPVVQQQPAFNPMAMLAMMTLMSQFNRPAYPPMPYPVPMYGGGYQGPGHIMAPYNSGTQFNRPIFNGPNYFGINNRPAVSHFRPFPPSLTCCRGGGRPIINNNNIVIGGRR